MFRGLPGRISIILSPPARFLRMSAAKILEVAFRDADRLGLRVRNHIRRYPVVRLPADFYAPTAGTDWMRPAQQTPVPGLALAGDYTHQQYLATMEGAVVSGRLAADAVRAAAQRRAA
jgi:15-cis-phytoene desaturase